MPQRPLLRAHLVIVRGIDHDVVLPGLATPDSPAEPEQAVGQPLPVHLPAGVASPQHLSIGLVARQGPPNFLSSLLVLLLPFIALSTRIQIERIN